MKQIDLGRSGLLGSEIALGCMRINKLSKKELDAYIRTALECGIDFFDHADIYGGGDCEAAFGQVLQNEPSLRDKMVLQGKCGIRPGMYDFSKEHILNSVDGILRRLRTDHLDLLLLHRPDALMEPEEVGEAFDQLEAAGKVKHFGVSNFNTRQLELLQSGLRQRLLVNQMEAMAATNTEGNPGYSTDRDGELLDYCRLRHVTVQAWSPFQYGFFEGVFVDNDKFPELNAALAKLSEKYGVTKSAMAVAWILRHPAKIQVIVGTTNAQRLRDIAAASTVALSREDWYELYRAAGNQLP